MKAAPCIALFLASWLASSAGAQGKPAARCAIDGTTATLSNAALESSFDLTDGRIRPLHLANRLSSGDTALRGRLFEMKMHDGTVLSSEDFHFETRPHCDSVPGVAGASRQAARQDAQTITGILVHDSTGLTVAWRASIGDDGQYLREFFTLTATREVNIAALSLISLRLPQASISGTADGTPIINGNEFYAFEHPMAHAWVTDGEATVTVKRELPMQAGVAVTYSTVMGVAAPGQMRRAFESYLEAERAHPFRTFLHYNSWYDIGYFGRYTEAEALGAIEHVGRELVEQRHVLMDSFLFDDGWDDPARLWEFNEGFPQGFTAIRAATEKYGAEPGVWLSPWGGYGPPRQARLAAGKSAGYEIDTQGLALSGPRYYARFHAAAVGLLQSFGVNQFKLDGTGSPDKVTPGSAFDSDFAAAMALIQDLRVEDPDLYINLTTGTWPSPFWLLSVDSIWRGGEDHEFAGRGSDRQRWITYRDADTYGGVVRLSPFYPLNALMLHGIIYARHARGLSDDPGGDLPDEVWSYFASGTGLQELYISADLLKPQDWDLIAHAAKWARQRASVLKDSHWQGGDPAGDEVYGWAAWSPERSVIALRNPSSDAKEYTLNLAAVLELPADASRAFSARTVYGRTPPANLVADRSLRLRLRSHEVLVWDLIARASNHRNSQVRHDCEDNERNQIHCESQN